MKQYIEVLWILNPSQAVRRIKKKTKILFLYIKLAVMNGSRRMQVNLNVINDSQITYVEIFYLHKLKKNFFDTILDQLNIYNHLFIL